MKIDFYYNGPIQDFKSPKDTLKRLLKELVPNFEINYLLIKDDASAKKFRVPGIPTIKFNGRDIDIERRNERTYSSSSRKYHDKDGHILDSPPEEMILEAIKEYIKDSETFHMEVKGAKKGDTPIC